MINKAIGEIPTLNSLLINKSNQQDMPLHVNMLAEN